MRELPWPFLWIANSRGQSINWCALCGPIRTKAIAELYTELRRKHRFVGFTSYSTFPKVSEGLFPTYEDLCEAWCHCFRSSDDFIAPTIPKALISESDFVSIERPLPGIVKEYDFAFVCLPGRWQEMTKNWPLAKSCLALLCLDMGLKGLLIGRWQILDLPFRENLMIKGDMDQAELHLNLTRCRMLLAPGILDASPRLLAECLCLNVPILVHRRGLGGWKYVNPSTGFFFEGSDVVDAAHSCLTHSTLEPRRWFYENYGPRNSSLALSHFLHSIDARVDPVDTLRLTRVITG